MQVGLVMSLNSGETTYSRLSLSFNNDMMALDYSLGIGNTNGFGHETFTEVLSPISGAS